MKTKYLELDEVWSDISAVHEFAQSISPDDQSFKHLHPAQLVKHILGLNKQFGKSGFELLYLWYDVPGQDGCHHRQEIDTFSSIAAKDSLHFRAMSYQELMLELASEYYDDHAPYINYLCNRYL